MGLFWVNVGEKDSFDMPTAKIGRARNTPLESGVYKYSRSQMYHKKAIYKFTKKTTPKPAAAKKPVFVEKKVGGAKTKVDVSGVKVPDHINDAYFKRAAAAKKAAAASGKKEGDIFESKKEEYKPSEQRKTDQVAVDKLLLEAVKKHADGKLLKQYLRTGFGLSKGDYPHKMVF